MSGRVTEDVGTTERKPLTRAQRLRLFEAHKGVCYRCDRPILAGEAWTDEHVRPLGLGGGNELENRRPVHDACAAEKTAKEDLPRIAKAKRQKMAHFGIKKKSTRSLSHPRYRKRLDGRVVDKTTGEFVR